MEVSWLIVVPIVMIVFTEKSYARILGLPSITRTLTDTSNLDITNCQKSCYQLYSLNTAACLLTPVCTECWNYCNNLQHTSSTAIKPTITTTEISSLSSSSSDEQIITNNNNQNQINPWLIRIASMVKQEFLVATHLAWEPSSKLVNCLVTWEVYGGGLMGNLLTDSANVELSLWPDTKYRVQVTCKNKQTKEIVKSIPIFVNTVNAIAWRPEYNKSSLMGTSAANSNLLKKLKNKYSLDQVKPVYSKSVSIDLNYHRNNEILQRNIKEIVLGICAALIVFLFILTLFCAFRGTNRYFIYKESDLCKHEILIR